MSRNLDLIQQCNYVGNSLRRVTFDGLTHGSDTSRVGRITSDVRYLEARRKALELTTYLVNVL